MVKIATWNVNSVKARLPNLLRWLAETTPDVVLLQELKCIDEQFPHMEVEELGYNIATNGQKTYNGVAILSKSPIEVELTALPELAGDHADDQADDQADEQARYLEAFTGGVRVASIYLPNGNPVIGDDGGFTVKYTYKLEWMERLYAHAGALLETEDAFVLGGDYNVIPEDGDVYNPTDWRDDALFRAETLAAFRKIVYLGLTDAFRATSHEVGRYSYWGYQGGAWQKDHGLRIDHLLLSPQAADRLTGCGIDKTPRGWEKPSDHTPVWCELEEPS